jgi:hypothetical protein
VFFHNISFLLSIEATILFPLYIGKQKIIACQQKIVKSERQNFLALKKLLMKLNLLSVLFSHKMVSKLQRRNSNFFIVDFFLSSIYGARIYVVYFQTNFGIFLGLFLNVDMLVQKKSGNPVEVLKTTDLCWSVLKTRFWSMVVF